MPSAKSLASVHRVIRIDEPSREGFKLHRAATRQTVAEAVSAAVTEQLGGLVEAVLALGLFPVGKKARPARLPFAVADLAALKEASKQSGIDQSALLVACLRRSAAESIAKLPAKGPKVAKPTKKRGRPVKGGAK